MVIGYRRVSRTSPCRICGKPDWCSTTIDHSISFCARSCTNADRLSRNGWGIYYRNNTTPRGSRYIFSARNTGQVKQPPIAPIDLRNKIYQKLIRLSQLSKYDDPRFATRMARVQIRDPSRYGLFPGAVLERHRLVRSLIQSFAKEEGSSPALIGVPGFWRGADGSVRLGGDFDSVDDLLIIPFHDRDSLIQACQIKFMGESPKMSRRYIWLSSVRQRDGCGPGTPLHHEGAVGLNAKTIEKVLVTEGALKAATVQTFLNDRYVVGNSGVATSHPEIIKTARKKTLEIAFDADGFTNPHVARAIASLISLRSREQQFLSYDHPTRILTWDKRLKGIDDALIAGAPIKNLHVCEWLRSLQPECFEAARHQLAGISF